MYKYCVFVSFILFTFFHRTLAVCGASPDFSTKNDEITLTVLTEMCAHLEGRPIALKVYVDGGVPDYTLYAGGLIVHQLSLNEFVILGLIGGEGTNVEVTDAQGNTAEFWAEAIIMPSPGAEAGPDMYISCVDSLARLEGFSETENVGYYWTSLETGQTYDSQFPEVPNPGIYYLTVTSKVNGCQSYDSTNVYLPEIPEFTFKTEALKCFEDSTGQIAFEISHEGLPPYNYSIDGGSSYQNNPVFFALPAGIYELVLRDRLGCRTDTIVELIQPDSIYLEIESPVDIHYGDLYPVVVESNIPEDEMQSISWIPETGLNCYDCLEPIASPEDSTLYQLTIVDNLGCIISDSLLVRVEKDKDVYIPNIFTPNDDGLNDIFFIKAANGVIRINSLKIFNRWGNLLFAAENIPPNDPAYGWDGKFRGHLLEPDVFVCVALVKLENGKELFFSKGFTLFR